MCSGRLHCLKMLFGFVALSKIDFGHDLQEDLAKLALWSRSFDQ